MEDFIEKMVAVQVKRCEIAKEFTGEQLNQMFGIMRDKTLHHIDTLYYAVFINEPEEIVKLQSENKLPENLKQFLNKLREMKSYVRGNAEGKLVEIAGMEASGKVFAMYEYCVSLNECFDIFIASYLPNTETPRIVVQLRSRYLVLEGVKAAVEKSFEYLCELLKPFELFPERVRENRIDYAFHTNLIQNPYKFFQDENLKKHLKSTLRKYQKIGNVGEEITVDTFNLGNRKSNNIYFRAYNKAREVIEMNYKSFFIERWRQNELISEFDKYVYNVAYELRSYRTGVLVGRLRWYIEYGKNEELKKECEKLIQTCYVNSDNCSQIEVKIHNVIPEPTLIFNIEYQTKRRFYQSCAEWMRSYDKPMIVYNEVDLRSLDDQKDLPPQSENDLLLEDLFFIIRNARAVIDYLTGYGNCVSFVKDRTMTMKQFLEEGEPYMNWWRRIRGTPIEYSAELVNDLYRTYDEQSSIKKSRRLLQGEVARLAILKKQNIDESSFVEDMSDALCVLNDNDMPPIKVMVDENGEIVEPHDYQEVRKRKARQMRGLVRKKKLINNYS
jgi:hypothetical protein